MGWTQVISKDTIAQFNYSHSKSSGYLNDPYKVVSIVDGFARPINRIVESRPSDRPGQSIYAAINKKTANGGIKPSFRYYTDDWGIDSQTVEFRYVRELGNAKEIEPYVRYYTQSGADFYRAQIPSSEGIPSTLSSDYRLSDFDALTVGFIYRWKGKNGTIYRVGLDIYNQSPDTHKDQLAGQADLNPGVNAVLVRFGFTF